MMCAAWKQMKCFCVLAFVSSTVLAHNPWNGEIGDGSLICRSVDEDVEIHVRLQTPPKGERLVELAIFDPTLKSRRKILFRGQDRNLQFHEGTFIAYFSPQRSDKGLTRLVGIPVNQFKYLVLNIDLSFYDGTPTARVYSSEVVYNTRSNGILTQDFDCRYFPKKDLRIGKA